MSVVCVLGLGYVCLVLLLVAMWGICIPVCVCVIALKASVCVCVLLLEKVCVCVEYSGKIPHVVREWT